MRLLNLLGGHLNYHGNYSYGQIAACTRYTYGVPDEMPSNSFEDGAIGELVARIQIVLRRTRGAEAPVRQGPDEVVRFDGWTLHSLERHLVSPGGMVVPLSNAEFRLLCTFLRMPRRVFSRDQLMEQARGRAMDAFERSIDLLVSRLRSKLADDPRSPSMIRTIRGAGYLFNVQSLQGQVGWPH